jgi:hypothetical protein
MSQPRAVVAVIAAIGIVVSAPLIVAAPGVTGDVAAPGVTGDQMGAGLSSRWTDGETWTRYHEAIDRTEQGLGLILEGKGGAALLSFAAQWKGRMAVGGPLEILVFIAPPPNFDPTFLRTPSLVFVVDAKTPRQAVLDWTPRLAQERLYPNQQPTSGIAKITLEELARLGQATSLSANVFSVDIEFKPSQRQALRNYAQKIASGR